MVLGSGSGYWVGCRGGRFWAWEGVVGGGGVVVVVMAVVAMVVKEEKERWMKN